jgi:hypothetical protein
VGPEVLKDHSAFIFKSKCMIHEDEGTAILQNYETIPPSESVVYQMT